MSTPKTVTALFALLFILLAPAQAQLVTGTVTGTVTDPSGSVVVGATIRLTNTGTGRCSRPQAIPPETSGFYS